jgi:hypothetical protein
MLIMSTLDQKNGQILYLAACTPNRSSASRVLITRQSAGVGGPGAVQLLEIAFKAGTVEASSVTTKSTPLCKTTESRTVKPGLIV